MTRHTQPGLTTTRIFTIEVFPRVALSDYRDMQWAVEARLPSIADCSMRLRYSDGVLVEMMPTDYLIILV